MRRKIILTSLILSVFLFLIWFGFSVFSPLPGQQQPTVEPAAEFKPDIDFSLPTPQPLEEEQIGSTPSLKQTAWIPDWDFANGFASFKSSYQYFDSVSPVWYNLEDDGYIRTTRHSYDELRSFTRQRGIELIPSIANFQADQLHYIINDDQRLEAHIQFLISEVEKYDYDGVDIDYESIYLEDQPEFLYLLRSLYEYLDPLGKKLSIAVMPIWSESDLVFSLRQTRQAQDYYEIGQYVHEFRIMSYNITNFNSTYPGPVAPLDWGEAVLRYTIPRVPSEKIFLGIGLYGYDGWSNNPVVPQPYLGITANGFQSTGQADAVTYDIVQNLRAAYKVSDILEPHSGEKLMHYIVNGKDYYIYYTDSKSTKPRIDLAERYRIAGVAHWRLGGEDPGVYSLIGD